ncbi:phytoene desaturase family protein [Pseudonocardia abyssalis]|uniref:NAD(P)/FAD-dependent oxidoreductase n=1 Tax=Pseudonocardia abyssalis TaxID=2792008 RepID=A0ABS6UQ48_9PSEU|nr:NAD(P)/FAD-dependent oxidoreductase [Pseudonocardia abyssalis]MBW0114738.1 NAD(P)/FAD-dependent oxidoreductase [Pseudonocardia abyssalis]MBW0134345.1 NAD(P)/FAD-dependent oxidoreductase [Pseudonocardia abyssalis]
MSAHADGFDAVVVGSGPNGLVGAARLAGAGARVLLVEANDVLGGGLRTEELTLPGFRHDVCATVVPLALASPAFRALSLEREGVEYLHPPVPAAHPLDGRDAALVLRSEGATAAGFGRDGAAWRGTMGATARAGFPLVDTLLAPLDLPPRAVVSLARYGASGALPATVTGRLFRDEPARAAFAGMAAHAILDLGSPVTAGYGMLLGALAHSVGWPVVRGGTRSLADGLAARLRGLGAEIVTGCRVGDLGELPPAPITLLDLTPRQFLAVAGDRLPAGYRRRLERFRYGSGVFKVDYALDGPVPWTDPAVAAAGTVHLGGTFAEVAAAEREVARGRNPERPFVLGVQACVADPSRAPEGRHTFWAYCHVPHGSDVDRTAAIEAQIERFAPGFGERVLARHVMGPAALEAHDANEVGGDINGGSGDWRQFVSRPVLARSPWRTPLPGVYLCSASTPPGGGVHGMGGWTAAGQALGAHR